MTTSAEARKKLTELATVADTKLFARIPDSELPYCNREDIAEIFETAKKKRVFNP